MRLALAAPATLLLLAACMPEAKAPDPASDYADYCAACHGAAGKGDGIAAAGLTTKPAVRSAPLESPSW